MIETVLAEARAAARAAGWQVETLAAGRGLDLLALTRFVPAPRQRLYLSAGIHGDEPAGPLALQRLLLEDRWPAGLEVRVCPCLNPTGFGLNRRENAQGADLNRDYRHRHTAEVRSHVAWLERQPGFDLTLCLHEDWEAHGFYLYELNPEQRPSLAASIIEAVAAVCPIDTSALIDGREAARGIIRPDLDPARRPQWPEAFYLLQHQTRQSYTFEAPSDFPLATRVSALLAATRTVLAAL